MGNYLETLKNISKDKNKKIENLVFLLILLVILLVASKYIFGGDKNSNNNVVTSNNTSSNDNIYNSNTDEKSYQSNLEQKLSKILSEISGISDVSVVITYSKEATTTPVYNVKEEEKGEEKSTEKTVVYNEDGSTKKVVIETVELPKVEGVIVVARGADSADIRSKIATAVSSITSVASYKVQVFEKD